MPRRILLLITDLEIGGTPTVVRELATRLHSPPDVEVEVACLSKWGPVADQIRDASIPVTALVARGVPDTPRCVKRLTALVKKHDIDTVFSFLIHSNLIAAASSLRLPGVRFIQSIQTIQPRPRWHWLAQWWAHRLAERVVVPSRVIVDAAVRRSHVPREKLTVIPNALDADDFPRVAVFNGPHVRAGYLGRLDPVKAPGGLIPALDCPDAEGVELHYFGDGPERTGIQFAVERNRFQGRVMLHGAVRRPQDALAQMDVLWQPSAVEGFGLVVIEAMASGVPVISVAAGGVLDIISHGQNGLLVEPADAPRQFAASTRLLRDDFALRNRLIEGGLRTVREKFTWEIVLPQYKRLLDLRS